MRKKNIKNWRDEERWEGWGDSGVCGREGGEGRGNLVRGGTRSRARVCVGVCGRVWACVGVGA